MFPQIADIKCVSPCGPLGSLYTNCLVTMWLSSVPLLHQIWEITPTFAYVLRPKTLTLTKCLVSFCIVCHLYRCALPVYLCTFLAVSACYEYVMHLCWMYAYGCVCMHKDVHMCVHIRLCEFFVLWVECMHVWMCSMSECMDVYVLYTCIYGSICCEYKYGCDVCSEYTCVLWS